MIPRYLESLVRDSLRDFPVVLVTGARQVGKSTLVQFICRGPRKMAYLTLDDRTTLDAGSRDPDGFIAANPGPVAIDEVQKVPDLLRAIKLSVDRNRKPGRFLLTGSANILTLKNVSETLAGRVALHELSPFSFAEFLKHHLPNILVHLFHCENAQDLASSLKKRSTDSDQHDFARQILRGGYPTPSLSERPSFRSRWFESYRGTYIERDIRDISAIERLSDFSRLMTLVAARTGQVLNYSDLGRDAGLPYITLRRYMSLLEQTYQIFMVPPFFVNISKRLTKAPKLYWQDTGMVCHLLGIHGWRGLEQQARVGSVVETWVAGELRKLISFSQDPIRLYGWRLHGGREVDFLLEKGNGFVAIEVKWSRRMDEHEFSAFQSLEESLKGRLKLKVFLYSGTEIIVFNPKLIAIPLTTFFAGVR